MRIRTLLRSLAILPLRLWLQPTVGRTILPSLAILSLCPLLKPTRRILLVSALFFFVQAAHICAYRLSLVSESYDYPHFSV